MNACLMLAEDLHRDGNLIEAVWWWLMALAFVYYAWRQTGDTRKRCWIAAAAFFLFGISDIVESRTGAWWKPWWLFVWKAACVLTILYVLIADWRARRKSPDTVAPADEQNTSE